MNQNGAMQSSPLSSNSSSSIRNCEPNPAEPLYQVKFLSALRSGDPATIHPFLAEIGKEKRKCTAGDVVDTGAAALHLAIRCASVETVSLLLSHRAISPNGIHPVGSGTTPLHLAASLGRVDVVNLLLEQDGVDDGLRDKDGKTCRDVTKAKDVIRAIDDSRSFLNASYRSLLRTYILSPPTAPPDPALLSLLESPRIRSVNVSYLDDSSGTSLLHEAARRKDLRLIELAVRAGADVFVRDRRGRMAHDGIGKDDRVRVFLRQFANQDTSLIDTPSNVPIILKGYLNKYTNVARGYSTRWFVLKGGVLSYYRHQEDETIASRGSISMKTAVLKVSPSGEKLRFEVHSVPSRGHSGVQKWYMKANHPVEASRWTQAIKKSIEWHKNEAGEEKQKRRKSMESESSVSNTIQSAAHSATHFARRSTAFFRHKHRSEAGSINSAYTELGVDGYASEDLSSTLHDGGAYVSSGNDGGDNGEFDNYDDDDSLAANSASRTPPHETAFELAGNSAIAQMELTSQLLAGISLSSTTSPSQTEELKSALQESFAVVQGLLSEYVQIAKERDAWWKSNLEREKMSQSIWEESLAIVVKDGEALEQELRNRSRRRGNRFLGDRSGTVRQQSSQVSSPVSVVDGSSTSRPNFLFSPTIKTDVRAPTLPSPTPKTPTVCLQQVFTSPAGDRDDGSIGTDDEDEFFDAIESNTLPNLVVAKSFNLAPEHVGTLSSMLNLPLYEGYANLRSQLNITADDRPSTSLWSVLKHSIGKDLSRITFPVFFNEPTSMLQRMAEDMEFSECLDVAAKEPDPHRRIAFVAAFGMSNYSSTIGRIAKPFNPMLSETFEYVRLDKEYRYVSEQVSHHPPISACWAESPLWHYFGEVDAQNKFMGKSFEIRPTGVAHAELIIPREWAPGYPKAKGKSNDEKVVEHYSWKKVTTNVSGFILGSPTIDHYGDMVITNHRTKDQCVLTFKPRGWRGRDAYEISGHVRDASGRVTYEIAGRWNSQLVARAVGSGSGFLHPDVSVSGPSSPTSSSREYILLWRNSEKPVAPFNLSPFAITLNDCPEDTLRPYLCPTDSRLRPDQRAFENGKYEIANTLKNMQEERQRATRKAREEGKIPQHKPRWFAAETDGDTGERVWCPSRVGDDGGLEYWIEREGVWKQDGNVQWKDVEAIFIEEPDNDE